MASYNPFADQAEDEDLSFLFDEKEKPKEEVIQEEKKAKTVGEIIESLDETVRVPIKEAFTGLASQIEELAKKPNMDQATLIQALQGLQSRQSTQPIPQKDEAEEAENEVKMILKEMGLEDDTKVTKFVRAVDKLSERRARTLYDPYVKVMSERYAKEERAAIASKYPQKDKDGNDTGYPTLESSAREIAAVIDRFPNMDLLEAYEWTHKDKIFGARQGGEKGKVEQKGNTGSLTANDILRKLSFSMDKPTTGTEGSLKTNGSARTIREAMAQAAKELGIK